MTGPRSRQTKKRIQCLIENELPPGTIEQMDRAFDLLKNQLSLHHTGLDCLDEPAPKPKTT
jgi:hypothetical protein